MVQAHSLYHVGRKVTDILNVSALNSRKHGCVEIQVLLCCRSDNFISEVASLVLFVAAIVEVLAPCKSECKKS